MFQKLAKLYPAESLVQRLDISVNNAATNPYFGHVLDTDLGAFNKTVEVNIRGYFFMSIEAGRLMRERDGGAIVNTASDAGLIGVKGLGHYSAAKHAVIGLTKSTALDYATKNIRVNAVCPGPIRTQMLERVFEENPKFADAMIAAQPVKRLGEPSEIGDAAVYLCSDAASYITGHALPVDGGYMAT